MIYLIGVKQIFLMLHSAIVGLQLGYIEHESKIIEGRHFQSLKNYKLTIITY